MQTHGFNDENAQTSASYASIFLLSGLPRLFNLINPVGLNFISTCSLTYSFADLPFTLAFPNTAFLAVLGFTSSTSTSYFFENFEKKMFFFTKKNFLQRL